MTRAHADGERRRQAGAASAAARRARRAGSPTGRRAANAMQRSAAIALAPATDAGRDLREQRGGARRRQRRDDGDGGAGRQDRERHRCLAVVAAAQSRGASTVASRSTISSSTRRPSSCASGASRTRWRKRRQGAALDVVGRDEVAPGEQRRGARGAHHRDRAARPAAGGQAEAAARRAADPHRVVDDALVDADLRGEVLQREQLAAPRCTRCTVSSGSCSPRWPCVVRTTIADFVAVRRIADLDLEQEAVELRLGQRIGALGLDRVLRRQHEERPLERDRLAFERDLVFLHHLEQRACVFAGARLISSASRMLVNTGPRRTRSAGMLPLPPARRRGRRGR